MKVFKDDFYVSKEKRRKKKRNKQTIAGWQHAPNPTVSARSPSQRDDHYTTPENQLK